MMKANLSPSDLLHQRFRRTGNLGEPTFFHPVTASAELQQYHHIRSRKDLPPPLRKVGRLTVGCSRSSHVSTDLDSPGTGPTS